MSDNRWQRIEDIFHRAVELAPKARPDFLNEVCAADESLRLEVESLLAHESEEGSTFMGPARGEAPQLAPGDTVEHYRIEARLGEGGMGVVYKAHDSRLGRSVALKFVKDQFSSGADREARAVASLNHPNICTLHDIGPNYLVMELIEGPTLEERIRGGRPGPIPLQEALAIASQIAAALEEAHEKGIVHRDLKPANLKLTAGGAVKVLDFGLAKTRVPSAGGPEDSPALTISGAQAGMILGTASYMSPEQANGNPVDRRSDIWAFGVVLHEMLTGGRLFQGETVTQILAEVLRGPIDLDPLPRETPPAVRGLLRRCLDRNPKTRLRDIGEARIAIEAASHPAEPEAPPPQTRTSFAWIAVAVLAVSLGALALIHFREAPPERQHVRFQIHSPEGRLTDFKLSPDGRSLAFVTVTGPAAGKIWIRTLDGLDTRLLTETRGNGQRYDTLFWSGDGEHIAFWSAEKLCQIDRNGGPRVVLADVPLPILGGVWLEGGVILFSTASGLFRVSSSGGNPVKIEDQNISSLAWLPARRFLYTRTDGIFAGSLDGRKPVQILPDHAVPTYVRPARPGLPGRLLFVRGETLLAQYFDADKLELQGEAIAVASPVGAGTFTASANGVLVFGAGNSPDVTVTWLDRAGKRLQTSGESFRLAFNPAIRLSPDDSRAIVSIADGNGKDLWIADLNRNTRSRFTFDGASSGIWSPDGRKVLWAANNGNWYLRPADGTGKDELLFKNPSPGSYVTDWSSDGRFIATGGKGEKAALNIWLVPAEGDRKPFPYIQSRFATFWGQISPNDRWMAYVTGQPAPTLVFVESIPAGKGRWQISTEGGDWPIWRRDGKELFYRQGTKIMAVPIRLTQTSVESGKPQALFEVSADTRFQVSRDGQRFLIALPLEGANASIPLTVDTDWRAGLAK
jgi:serine/threonine protein kinase/Tol biopolymer transport system component